MEGRKEVDFAERLRKEDQERYERMQQEWIAEWEAARIVRCPNGHFYNASSYQNCPDCDMNEKRALHPEDPSLSKLPQKIVRCHNGHYFDINKFAACPICTEENPPENSEIVSLGEGPRMVKYRVTRCSNNHHYISSFEKDCPLCEYKPINPYDTDEYRDQYFDFTWEYYLTMSPSLSYHIDDFTVDNRIIENLDFVCPHCGSMYSPSYSERCTNCYEEAPEEIKRNPYKMRVATRPRSLKWFHLELDQDPVQQRPVVGKLRCMDRIAQEVSWDVYTGDNVIAQVMGTIPVAWDRQVGKEQHACISYNSEDHSFHISPLGDNAVSVNDEPVSTEAVLHDGDVIAVGVTHMVFSPLPEEVLKTIA